MQSQQDLGEYRRKFLKVASLLIAIRKLSNTERDDLVRQLDQAVGVQCQKLELQCYRAYKHAWSLMSETEEN
jgi:hypothetical protein